MTKIGLLGAGRIGQVHARAVLSVPSAQLVAVADPIPAAAKRCETPMAATFVRLSKSRTRLILTR